MTTINDVVSLKLHRPPRPPPPFQVLIDDFVDYVKKQRLGVDGGSISGVSGAAGGGGKA